MVRLDRIYTRTGDDGSTSLIGGNRVLKSDVRIEAYGVVDELNAALGVLLSQIRASAQLSHQLKDQQTRIIQRIQNNLFDVGSLLACPPDQTHPSIPSITVEQISWLEESMDHYQDQLEPLNSFVLPGGGLPSSLAHLARTICRRLERVLVQLAQREPLPECILEYINRLSDFLFVLSRWLTHQTGESETLWEPGR